MIIVYDQTTNFKKEWNINYQVDISTSAIKVKIYYTNK